MDFYKLTDFQLYSIIHSRHLDNDSHKQAERELERRHLSAEKMEELKSELAEKSKAIPSSFLHLSPNILLLVGAVILLLLLKQCVMVR